MQIPVEGFTKILITAALITAPVIIESCVSEECMCCGTSTTAQAPMSVKEINLKTGGLPYSSDPPPEAATPGKYTFVVSFMPLLAQLEHPKKYGTMAAYACEPLPTPAVEKIEALTIVSSNDLTTVDNGSFAAGNDLTGIFRFNVSSTPAPIAELYAQTLTVSYAMFFTTNVTVPTAQDHVFTFKFTLSDGRIFELDSAPCRLIPG